MPVRASALSRIVFEGSVPVFVQAPPTSGARGSINATFLPKYAACAAPFSPAGPLPRTTRSYEARSIPASSKRKVSSAPSVLFGAPTTTADPPRVRSTDPRHPIWNLLLAVATATNVVALWSAPYLPFTDLPQHAAAIATLRHFDDPAWKSREYFTLALFYLHLSAFLLFAMAAALAQVIVGPRRPADLARRFVWTLPTLGLGIAFLFTSPVVHPERVGWNQPVAIWFEPAADAIKKLPEALLDIWPGDEDQWISLALVAAAVALAMPRAAAARVPGRRFALALLWTALAVALYFWFPISIGWLWQLNERYAIAAALLVPLLLRPRRGLRGALPLLVAFAVGVASAGVAARQAREFSREADGFDRVLSRAQPGRRLLTLVYERGSRTAKFVPYLHFGSYYRARGGGIAAFSFAGLPEVPRRYRPETEPPRHPVHWEWEPWQFDPIVDGNYYDYVLVRGAIDPFARAGTGPRFRRIAHEGLWSLYAKD